LQLCLELSSLIQSQVSNFGKNIVIIVSTKPSQLYKRRLP